MSFIWLVFIFEIEQKKIRPEKNRPKTETIEIEKKKTDKEGAKMWNKKKAFNRFGPNNP